MGHIWEEDHMTPETEATGTWPQAQGPLEPPDSGRASAGTFRVERRGYQGNTGIFKAVELFGTRVSWGIHDGMYLSKPIKIYSN